MSVLVKDRKKSDFEVFHQLKKIRKEITDYLFHDFRWDETKLEAKLRKEFRNKPPEQMTPSERERCERKRVRYKQIDARFISEERDYVINIMRHIAEEVYIANSIYPTYRSELERRRLHQDEAIGLCFTLQHELEYAMENLPVDFNAFQPFQESIGYLVALIKGWRKGDNKFLKVVKDREYVTDKRDSDNILSE